MMTFFTTYTDGREPDVITFYVSPEFQNDKYALYHLLDSYLGVRNRNVFDITAWRDDNEAHKITVYKMKGSELPEDLFTL